MNNTKDIRLYSQKVTSGYKPSRLALSIGPTFIGWTLYHIDESKKPKVILGSGVRCFSSGRRAKDSIPLNAIRRQARLQRRQRDRYLQRRNYLLHLLKEYHLFPQDKFSAKKLAHLNPYELRARGLNEKLDIYHFGRVLFHLNQKRGFKSNRKVSDIAESGLISKSIKATQNLMEQHHFRTYGELLWYRFQEMEKSRRNTKGSQEKNWVLARKPIGSGAMGNYSVYSNRTMIENEFYQLWDFQSHFHEQLKNQALKKLFFHAIFHQRALRKTAVGTCEFTGEHRAIKALPSVQNFKILKKLNCLSYYDDTGKLFLLNTMDKGLECRNKMIQSLFFEKGKNHSFRSCTNPQRTQSLYKTSTRVSIGYGKH